MQDEEIFKNIDNNKLQMEIHESRLQYLKIQHKNQKKLEKKISKMELNIKELLKKIIILELLIQKIFKKGDYCDN